jgi:hypothetical protein
MTSAHQCMIDIEAMALSEPRHPLEEQQLRIAQHTHQQNSFFQMNDGNEG